MKQQLSFFVIMGLVSLQFLSFILVLSDYVRLGENLPQYKLIYIYNYNFRYNITLF